MNVRCPEPLIGLKQFNGWKGSNFGKSSEFVFPRLTFALTPVEETRETSDTRCHVYGRAVSPAWAYLSSCLCSSCPALLVFIKPDLWSGCVLHTLWATTRREDNKAPNPYAHEGRRNASEISIPTALRTWRCFTRINFTFISGSVECSELQSPRGEIVWVRWRKRPSPSRALAFTFSHTGTNTPS